MPVMLEVYSALELLLNAKEIKNLENKYKDSLTSEGVKDVRSQFMVKVLLNPLPFWNAENRQAWVYQAYHNMLKDKFKSETLRNPYLLQKMILKYHEEILFLNQHAIETNEDLSSEIEKVKIKLHTLEQLQIEIENLPRVVEHQEEMGCAFYCLEKLAKDDSRRYALFAAKVLDHTPGKIELVVEGILQKKYTSDSGIGQMISQFKNVYVDFFQQSPTEAQFTDLLAKVFGYTKDSVNVTISQIKNILQACVIDCEKKHI